MRLAARAILAIFLIQLAVVSHGLEAGAVVHPSCPSTWTAVAVPSGQGGFDAIGGTQSNDLWAVGESVPSMDALIDHWNGTSWSIAQAPAVNGDLRSVDSQSSTDAWAVGSSPHGTLAEHWDGSSWSVVPTPNPGNYSNSFNSISGTGPNDQWAVGSQLSKSGSTFVRGPLVEHWDGSSWQAASLPPTGDQLLSVKAVSPTSVWGVGYSGIAGGQEVTLHWNGTAWDATAGTAGNNYILNGLNQNGHQYGWVAGEFALDGTANAQVLTWNHRQKQWQPVSTALPSQGNSALLSIVRVQAKDIWAVGTAGTSPTSLIEHSTGGAFTIDPSGTVNGALSSVVAVGPHPKTVWAAGYTNSSTPLVMERCA